MSTKLCRRCNTLKPFEEFYVKRSASATGPISLPSQLSAYCKKCSIDQCVELARSIKDLALEYRGGKCIICGYHRCPDALEFHHVDPETKSFSISTYMRKHLRSLRFTEELKAELNKTVILCRNCHSEVHAKMLDLEGNQLDDSRSRVRWVPAKKLVPPAGFSPTTQI
jgi:hypothetical protein